MSDLALKALETVDEYHVVLQKIDSSKLLRQTVKKNASHHIVKAYYKRLIVQRYIQQKKTFAYIPITDQKGAINIKEAIDILGAMVADKREMDIFRFYAAKALIDLGTESSYQKLLSMQKSTDENTFLLSKVLYLSNYWAYGTKKPPIQDRKKIVDALNRSKHLFIKCMVIEYMPVEFLDVLEVRLKRIMQSPFHNIAKTKEKLFLSRKLWLFGDQNEYIYSQVSRILLNSIQFPYTQESNPQTSIYALESLWRIFDPVTCYHSEQEKERRKRFCVANTEKLLKIIDNPNAPFRLKRVALTASVYVKDTSNKKQRIDEELEKIVTSQEVNPNYRLDILSRSYVHKDLQLVTKVALDEKQPLFLRIAGIVATVDNKYGNSFDIQRLQKLWQLLDHFLNNKDPRLKTLALLFGFSHSDGAIHNMMKRKAYELLRGSESEKAAALAAFYGSQTKNQRGQWVPLLKEDDKEILVQLIQDETQPDKIKKYAAANLTALVIDNLKVLEKYHRKYFENAKPCVKEGALLGYIWGIQRFSLRKGYLHDSFEYCDTIAIKQHLKQETAWEVYHWIHVKAADRYNKKILDYMVKLGYSKADALFWKIIFHLKRRQYKDIIAKIIPQQNILKKSTYPYLLWLARAYLIGRKTLPSQQQSIQQGKLYLDQHAKIDPWYYRALIIRNKKVYSLNDPYLPSFPYTFPLHRANYAENIGDDNLKILKSIPINKSLFSTFSGIERNLNKRKWQHWKPLYKIALLRKKSYFRD